MWSNKGCNSISAYSYIEHAAFVSPTMLCDLFLPVIYEIVASIYTIKHLRVSQNTVLINIILNAYMIGTLMCQLIFGMMNSYWRSVGNKHFQVIRGLLRVFCYCSLDIQLCTCATNMILKWKTNVK